MVVADVADVKSGSLLNRSATGALYVLAGNITLDGLSLSDAATGAAPSKSGATAALRSGDIAIALRGWRNTAAVVPDLNSLDFPLFASMDVAIIRPFKAIHSPYLAWLLNDLATQEGFALQRSGSAAPRLPLAALKALPLPMPPLQQQIIIAALATEARREDQIVHRIQQSRNRLLNELLRKTAERGPRQAPTWHGPNVASSVTERPLGQSPTDTIGTVNMANNTSGRKGGTTHVVPAQQGGWNVKQGGAQRATGHFDTKADAVAAGRVSSRARESELKIHNLDGKIAQSDSHGNDPRSTKG
jgi:hypothetical protein